MIPNLSLRGAKKPPAKPAVPQQKKPSDPPPPPPPTSARSAIVADSKSAAPVLAASGATTVAQVVVTALKTEPAVSTVAATAATRPSFDATQHALSCLASLSHNLAQQVSNPCRHLLRKDSFSASFLTSSNELSSNTSSPAPLRLVSPAAMLRRRRNLLESYAAGIGRSVVRTAIAVGTKNVKAKKRRREKQAKKAALLATGAATVTAAAGKKKNNTSKTDSAVISQQKQQQQVVVIAASSSISGSAKREKAAKFQQAKQRQKQFDRRHLCKFFCLGCGLPRVAGFRRNFSLVALRRKGRREQKERQQAGSSPIAASASADTATKSDLPKMKRRFLLRCNMCFLRQQRQRRMLRGNSLHRRSREKRRQNQICTSVRFDERLHSARSSTKAIDLRRRTSSPRNS